MKRAIWLAVGVFCSAILLFAQTSQNETSQDQTSPKETGHQMMGTICSSACVVRQANTPTCDTTCTDKSGPAVFVSDSGKVQQIANQQMAMPHMGKHVKIMAVPTEKEREESLRIMQLYEQGP